jgi:hypothetical protein
VASGRRRCEEAVVSGEEPLGRGRRSWARRLGSALQRWLGTCGRGCVEESERWLAMEDKCRGPMAAADRALEG